MRPWYSQYWLNSPDKQADWEEFRTRANEVCDMYAIAQELEAAGHHVISVDEKTGIAAKERKYPDKPAGPGRKRAVDHEYNRHGATDLIAMLNVANGKIPYCTLTPTRTAQDFTNAIARMLLKDASTSIRRHTGPL